MNERFEALAGVKITDIHYRGSAPAITDLLSGQVQMYFDTVVTAMPQLRAGKLRALAVSTEERSPLLPEVPTFRVSGYPGLTQRGWFGVFAPAATPRAVVERMTFTPEGFDAFIKKDLAPWAHALKALNIQLE